MIIVLSALVFYIITKYLAIVKAFDEVNKTHITYIEAKSKCNKFNIIMEKYIVYKIAYENALDNEFNTKNIGYTINIFSLYIIKIIKIKNIN
jgi:hypothetical protein